MVTIHSMMRTHVGRKGEKRAVAQDINNKDECIGGVSGILVVVLSLDNVRSLAFI